MKVAVYSRALELGPQKDDIQLFFNELQKEEITPVISTPFLEELHGSITLPDNFQTFSSHEELTDDIDFLVSLGGDGTLLPALPHSRTMQWLLPKKFQEQQMKENKLNP